MPFLQSRSIEEYIQRHQVDGILWKADRLLSRLDNPILRNDRTMEVAAMLASIPEATRVMRDDYIKKICIAHDLKPKTLEKMIADVRTSESKSSARKARKNKVKTLDTDPKRFPFFKEFVKENNNGVRTLDKIKIDKLRFVQLLGNFGFTRHETNADDKDGQYTFVRVVGNVITSVTRDQIIDFVERFVKQDYDFEAVKCEFVDAELLINTFYDQMRTIFSKDLFARVRLDSPVIISKDKATITYLYFKNGFVEITADGYKLLPYKDMDGSVWDHQLKDRNFHPIADPIEELDWTEDGQEHQNYKCVFADFIWKICGQDKHRFIALCAIIGYIIHDFYAYNLKSIYLTDSTVSDVSEGRTGKTLLMKMIGEVRSYCEIHGKNFNPYDDKRYETVKMGTQVVHINDVSSKGKNRFELEPMFNDITEGLHVRALYMAPFRQYSKMVISGNKSLYVSGDSAAARVMEFELSNFFSIRRRPDQFYGHWFGRDWNSEEWNRFDNFICLCAQAFHLHGLQEPPVINLKERKLLDHTAPEFLEFMDDIEANLTSVGLPWSGYTTDTGKFSFAPSEKVSMSNFQFDRKALYDRFVHENSDFKATWFTMRKFKQYLLAYSEYRMGIKRPLEWKSNGLYYIQFVDSAQKDQ